VGIVGRNERSDSEYDDGFPILQMGNQDVVHLKEKIIAKKKNQSGVSIAARQAAQGRGHPFHVVGAAEVA
jgi:hypothetical protein